MVTSDRSLLLRIAALALATGCQEEFRPITMLDDARILALIADPLEAGPDDEVRVQAVVHVDEADPIAQRGWSVCPLTLGARAAFACVVPTCATELEPEEDGAVRLTPGALALSCLLDQGGVGDGPPSGGQPSQGPFETLITHRVETASGVVREAMLRLPLWLGEPPERNQHPVVESFTAEGDAQSLTLELEVSDNTPDTLVAVWLSNGGRFALERTDGVLATNSWTPEKDPVDELVIYAVIIDGFGGQTVAGPLRPDLGGGG